jgi:short-subunit dehydrogenase
VQRSPLPNVDAFIITGASSGLGEAIAYELAQKKLPLILVGRNEKKLISLAENLRSQFQNENSLVPCDLSDLKSVAELGIKCREKMKSGQLISGLIHCAGFAVTGRMEEIPAEAMLRCWNVNFVSAVSLASQILPRLKENKKGWIVNVGSGVAGRALPYLSPYCSAKAALHSYTESLQVEMKNTGVNVMLFSPGPVASHFHESTEHFGKTTLVFPPFHGKPPVEIAQIFIRAFEKNKSKVIVGGKANIAKHLNYWLPRFTDFLVSRLYQIKALS